MFSTNIISHYILISLQLYLTHNLLALNQPDMYTPCMQVNFTSN